MLKVVEEVKDTPADNTHLVATVPQVQHVYTS